MREVIRNSTVAATAASLTLALGGNAQASSPCPQPERLKSVSERCHNYLMRVLQRSVYDDPSEQLRVVTYQKLAGGLAVDGALGPMTARSILRGNGLNVPSPDPSSTEKELYVDKSSQVMFTISRGKVRRAFSVSTGTEQTYGNGQLADTPTGTFRITREMGPDYKSPLGAMPNAHFFEDTQGIAVHSGFVDADGRDSHGCVRVDNAAMVRYIAPNFAVGNIVKVVE